MYKVLIPKFIFELERLFQNSNKIILFISGNFIFINFTTQISLLTNIFFFKNQSWLIINFLNFISNLNFLVINFFFLIINSLFFLLNLFFKILINNFFKKIKEII